MAEIDRGRNIVCAENVNTWLPNIISDDKYEFRVSRRLESPCGESVKTKYIQEVGGYPEHSYGWGNLESTMHQIVCPKMGSRLVFCNRIFSVELPNFPEKPLLPPAPPEYAHGKVTVPNAAISPAVTVMSPLGADKEKDTKRSPVTGSCVF